VIRRAAGLGTILENPHFSFGQIAHIEGRIRMRRALIAATAAVALLASSQAIAQTATITISPEQRTKIKEYVVKQKVKPVTVKERITVGSRLPADVELAAVPSDWGPTFSRYRYVYSDNHVALVDPGTREVVQLID
jgi:hypothetical protein